MPVFLAPLFTKAGLYAVIGLGLVAAALYAVHHFESVGAAKEIAAVQAATAAEHKRRTEIETWAQQWASGAIKKVDDLNGKNSELRKQIAAASAAHDRAACLLPDAVQRLDGLRSGGASGRQAGH